MDKRKAHSDVIFPTHPADEIIHENAKLKSDNAKLRKAYRYKCAEQKLHAMLATGNFNVDAKFIGVKYDFVRGIAAQLFKEATQESGNE